MIPFSKYSGAGNDFVLAAEEQLAGGDPSDVARRICPRSTGVGVDGLVVAARDAPGRFRVRFFNPDGSEIDMCGNGTRCVARYLVDEGWADPRHVLLTGQGPIQAEVGDGQVALVYRLRPEVEEHRELETPDGPRRAWLVRIGVPHLVLPLEEMPEGPIGELCRPLRRHRALGPGGANVNLVELGDADSGSIRTWERGVEGETSACGSGAMATLLALNGAGLAGPELDLTTRSGAALRVARLGDDSPGGRNGGELVRLSGPAVRIFEGRFPRPS